MDDERNVGNTIRWRRVGLALAAGAVALVAFLVATDGPQLLKLAIVLVGISIFGGIIVQEGRRAFGEGADVGEAAVHGLTQALRAYFGMRPKDPPKY